MKALPRHMLDAGGVHAALLQHALVLRREVFPHHANHAHLRKVAGGQCKVRRRASQRMIDPAARSFNAVKRNAANNHNGHAGFL